MVFDETVVAPPGGPRSADSPAAPLPVLPADAVETVAQTPAPESPRYAQPPRNAPPPECEGNGPSAHPFPEASAPPIEDAAAPAAPMGALAAMHGPPSPVLVSVSAPSMHNNNHTVDHARGPSVHSHQFVQSSGSWCGDHCSCNGMVYGCLNCCCSCDCLNQSPAANLNNADKAEGRRNLVRTCCCRQKPQYWEIRAPIIFLFETTLLAISIASCIVAVNYDASVKLGLECQDQSNSFNRALLVNGGVGCAYAFILSCILWTTYDVVNKDYDRSAVVWTGALACVRFAFFVNTSVKFFAMRSSCDYISSNLLVMGWVAFVYELVNSICYCCGTLLLAALVRVDIRCCCLPCDLCCCWLCT